eukprot:1773003-Rhodomonas_salina.1
MVGMLTTMAGVLTTMAGVLTTMAGMLTTMAAVQLENSPDTREQVPAPSILYMRCPVLRVCRSYMPPMPGPVLCDVRSGTARRHAGTTRLCCAMSGTEIAYATTRSNNCEG